MGELISVIIPVYNVEKYLKECIESVIGQSYQNLEIILIDDGSTDKSGMICDKYADVDARIVCVHKKNGGLSDARNSGLDIMTGQYLVFVDSDDFLPINAIEVLYNIITEKRADIVIGNYIRVDEKGIMIQENLSYSDVILTREEAMENILTYGCAAWARMFSKRVHNEYRFPVDEINEDEAIVLKILEKCSIIATTAACVYNYRCRDESITTQVFSKKRLVWKKHCLENVNFIKQKYPQLETLAMKRYRGCLLYLITEIALCNNDKDYEIEIREIMGELLANEVCFMKIPFEYKSDYWRMRILDLWGYEFYSKMIRVIRRVHK